METILIVDDEKNYLTILSALLEEEGYEVLGASGGQEALQIQKTSDLDLILTDRKMPGMDGIALLEKIKADDPDLPVIMMTAHGTVDKAVEAMQKGAYTYILKPFDNERLIIYVKKVNREKQKAPDQRTDQSKPEIRQMTIPGLLACYDQPGQGTCQHPDHKPYNQFFNRYIHSVLHNSR